MIFLPLVLVLGLVVQVFVPGFPKETIMLLAGATFGLLWGSIINWLGMVIGAQVAYELVRRSIKVGGRYSDILEDYQTSSFVSYVRDYGNQGLFLVRLIPYAPNDVLSLVSGALFLPRRGFFLVSCITAIPYALLFAQLGVVGEGFLGTFKLVLINLAILVVSLVGYGIYSLARRMQAKT